MNLEKVRLILSTGFPGLSKLIIIAIIFLKFGPNVSGMYSYYIAIPFTISLFTSLGYSSKVLKVIPVSTEKLRDFGSILISSIVYLLIGFFALGVTLYSLDVKYKFFAFVFLTSQHFYQIYRSYFIAEKLYSKCIFFECFILILYVFSILITKSESDLFLVLAVSNSLIFVIFYVRAIVKSLGRKIVHWFEQDVFIFSMNNLVGGAVSSLLPVVLSSRYSFEQIGVISLVTSMCNIFLIFPRSMVNYKLPSLVRLKQSDILGYFTEVKNSRKLFFIVLFSSCILSSIINAGLFSFGNVLNDRFDSQYAFLSVVIAFNIYISSLPLYDGAVLFVEDKQIVNVISNVIYLALFFLFISIIYLLDLILKIETFFLLMIIFAAMRYLYLYYEVKNEHKSNR
ncbi:membrane hypothetical protein [Vibrio chagasii]|nr:membrane hypothetical protein [Vibrio chagasii]CAH7054625.1 membrane hypothetical protein [Vibrio chagasii]CAH7064104.1 membrane hypothetical protein [Vibrio chagasii]CAH7361482.1 membrane hypothetical protein [Vibrio chagasii]CAH7378127.1 membrane hypothetical protein [Vibrio chagasii]